MRKNFVFQYLILTSLSLLFLACGDSDKSNSKDDKIAYLFTYFTGNGEGEEAIRYALSKDGYNYYALNNNEPIISSDEISNTGGVRDPHILRGADGSYRMVVTDLLTQNGWSNIEMVLLKSDNLIDWTSTVINIPETFDEFSDVSRVWAPQTFYDEEKEKYMVYFSMLQPDSYDKIYYAYANDNFTELETTPQQLFFNPNEMASIDGDIIKKDGKFHLFYKTEGDDDKGIKVAISDSLTGGYEAMEGNVDQTDQAVEGSGVFKLINSDKYILMYDVYRDGRYEFAESTDLKNFELVSEDISMNFHPRHGTVLPITEEEVNQLLEAFPSDDFPVITGSSSSAVKQKNIIIDETEKSIYLPVKNGTDLSNFNPELETFPGIEITNTEAKNFESGLQEYTVKLANGEEQPYNVQVEVANNPVVEGYYADPEIIYSEKEEKFYLYPTSDGFHGWSGTYFETFSSKNLINWKNEGTILDLKKDVDWADRNAWAPCAIEKEIDGEYKYFYYFTAAQKIGVAVADQPEGPFEDIGEPLISEKPEGVKGGQVIDPDVFTDPESGKSYLYWGNGFMAVAELNEDMTSLKEGTEKVITPDNSFREGAEVFFRDGKYYFLWSENDTRSPDYRVRYATSTSPTGPLEIPEENMVIEKDEENEIYGTGHNSVIQVPGKDEWYIVYHRFTRPKGIDMGQEAGFHREVAIDKLEFDEDGAIKKVNPTVKGIESLKTSE
jgi:hypothetical protein